MQKVHFLWTKIYMRQPKTLWFSMYPFLINAAFSVLCLFDSKVGENVSYDMLYVYVSMADPNLGYKGKPP